MAKKVRGNSLFSSDIGIDLGTANTLVYVPGKGVVLNEPSVVAISEIDKRILAVGVEAKEMIGRTPGEIIAYRPMKDGVISDYRVTQAMLRYFISKALGKMQLFRPEVMVSVPTGVTSTERRAVVEAAIRALAAAVRTVIIATHGFDLAARADQVLLAAEPVAAGPPQAMLAPDRLSALFGVALDACPCCGQPALAARPPHPS